MKIIEPSVEFYTESNPLQKIERVARVCWNTENRITYTSARPFCEKLLKMGHLSPFEHARVIVPDLMNYDLSNKYHKAAPYGFHGRITVGIDDYSGEGFTMMNARDFLALGGTLDQLSELENADDYATVLFIIDIGISRELIRHRQMSFMERSTRYVNMANGIDFIRPLPFEWANDKTDCRFVAWTASLYHSETSYENMIDRGCTPQEARSVLTLSTATRLYVTGMYSQWCDVLKLRAAPGAHPSMQYAMKLLLSNPDCPEEIKIFS